VGNRLIGLQGRSLRIQIHARRYASVGHNVIGRLAGAEAERVTVASHYDSAANVSGATDNASGTAALLTLCEAFAMAGQRRLTIDFVAYGAEEYGRHGGNLGAVEYVRRNADEVRQSLAMVEMDCIGTVAGPLKSFVLAWPPARSQEKKDEILGFLRRLSGCVLDDRSGDSSATTAFHLPGVPSIVFIDDYSQLPIHTSDDRIDLMRPEAFAHATNTIATTINHFLS
jgi:Zn-dependent M28 family amino/carboxypeptidase